MTDYDRVDVLADTFANLGHEGIAAFDETEPEYDTLATLFDRYDSPDHVTLLGILAASQDYQLNGDAQEFWRQLEETAADYEALASTQTVRNLLGDFMEADVNARLNRQKRDRLVKILDAGFDDWFIANHVDAEPLTVWEELAAALGNRMQAKTVVLSMKIYDIAMLLRTGEYLEFPHETPIPCDLQVERVSRTSGLTESEDTGDILEAWAAVMEETSERLGEHVSLLRMDSIVWQAGQIIGQHERQNPARNALEQHFKEVGISEAARGQLAAELSLDM